MPLILLVLPFKNILDRGRHFDLRFFPKEKTQDNYQNLKNVPNFRKGGGGTGVVYGIRNPEFGIRNSELVYFKELGIRNWCILRNSKTFSHCLGA